MGIKSLSWRLLLATIGGLPVVAFAATPEVTGVSGKLQFGQILTVTGSNMINEDRTSWDPFFISNPNASGFEGATPGADGYGDIGPTGGTYDSTVKLLGSKSMKFHARGASTNCPVGNLEDYNAIDPAGGDSNDLWIRVYARWNLNGGGWPGSHIKMVDAQGGGAQYYFQPSPSGGNLPATFDAVFDGVSRPVAIPSGPLENGRWYGIEIHWRSTGSNIFAAWIDGTQVINAAPASRGSLNYILFGLINLCDTNSSFNLDHWMDGFAVATSRVRLASIVEIGNSSNYATATKVYQAPVSLSESSIQIKANLTGLGAGPYYLWVTNNRGERSQAFSLTSFPSPQNLIVK